MKNFIRICIFTCLLFVVFVSNVFAQDRIEEGVLYIEDGTIDISYAKYRRNSEITSVVIPQSVKRIGYEAFRECPNLQTVIIPETVSVIDSWAFAKCEKLENVTINKGTTAINEYAFYGCSALKNIQVPGTVSVIGKWAFGKCTALETVILREGVSMIVECAFYGCTNLQTITLPESLTAIGRFFPTKISLKGIKGSYAESYALEKNINFEVIGYSLEFAKNAKILDLDNKIEIYDEEYKNFVNLEKVLFGEGLTKIGKEAFAFSKLSKVNIPDSVTFIGSNAFARSSVICGSSDSYGIMWAKRNGYKFEVIDTVGIKTNYPSQEQIIQYLKNNPIYIQEELQGELYDVIPCFDGEFVAGKLSFQAKNNGLKAMNTIRYMAGLSLVEIDSEYEQLAQLAASANAAQNTLTHKFEKLPNMSEEDYENALKGAQASNLAKGQESLPLAILRLNRDSVSKNTNVDSLTHRRWILNPAMKKTGFGIAQKVYAQYAGDISNENIFSDTKIVCWPPKNMPLEYATKDDPYSVFLTDDFEFDSEVSVSMVRSGDGGTWNFTAAQSDGYFRYAEGGNNVHTKYIAWKPDNITDYMVNDIVEIIINGVKKDGKGYPIKYSVTYFNALPTDKIEDGVLYVADGTKIITRAKYKNNADFSKVVIPESVVKIDKEAFRNCSNLKTLEVPPSVKIIDEWAFAECSALEDVQLSEGVNSVKKAAFYKCDNVKYITLPSTIFELDPYLTKTVILKCNSKSYGEFLAKKLGLKTELIDNEMGNN